MRKRRLSPETIDGLLHGRVPADREDLASFAEFAASLREEFAHEPVAVTRVRPAETGGGRRVRVVTAALAGCAGLTFSGMASAGALPDEVQHAVASAAARVGFGFVPDPEEDQRPAGTDSQEPAQDPDDTTGDTDASGTVPGDDSEPNDSEPNDSTDTTDPTEDTTDDDTDSDDDSSGPGNDDTDDDSSGPGNGDTDDDSSGPGSGDTDDDSSGSGNGDDSEPGSDTDDPDHDTSSGPGDSDEDDSESSGGDQESGDAEVDDPAEH